MSPEIRPTPTPAERRAILAALAARRVDPYASAWRRAGLDYATARPGPRSRLGAERA